MGPPLLAVVLVGGAIGTAAREGLSLAFPTIGGVLPIAVLVINVVGAFVLGLLLEALLRLGPDVGRRRIVRLGIGTGFCGGFTTYSTLAVETAELLVQPGSAGIGLGYAIGSVLLGALAAWKDFPERLCRAGGLRGLVFSRPGYGGSGVPAHDRVWQPDFLHRQAHGVGGKLAADVPVRAGLVVQHTDLDGLVLRAGAAGQQPGGSDGGGSPKQGTAVNGHGRDLPS